MKKVTIIIPNHNDGKCIEECIDSVLIQDYPEKEIIIVDDGSTDDSVEVIRKVIKNHKKDDIKFLRQENLNAAIARNRGMEIATGDYILFLDSDDLLKKDAISCLVDVYEKNKTDLVIGNYTEIDERGKKIDDRKFTDKNISINPEDSFDRLVGIDPVPSNKLYVTKIIKDNNLEWGNVKIGQDTNFYLKYLSLCKKVTLVNKDIYEYRIKRNSMTRTYDFRIFDIVNSFSDIERFYKKNDKESMYKKYIPIQMLRRYEIQMDKQIFYRDRATRNLIVRYFSINEKKIDYSLCKRDNNFKKMHLKFRVKCAMRWLLTSWVYRRYTAFKRRKNG